MDKVKKQFKDFWNFYRLNYYGTNIKETAKSYSFPFVMIFIAAFLTGVHLSASAAYGLLLVAGLIAISVGRVTYDKTALISVAPFSPVQRVVFTYLTMLLNVFFFVAAVTVLDTVVILIIAFIAFCATGENVFFTESVWEQTPVSANAVGVWLLTAAIVFFAAIAVSHIDKTKTRNIATGAFLALNEAMMLIITNIIGFSTSRGILRNFYYSIDLNEYIDLLDRPWILLVVLGVIAAAVTGVSIRLVIKRHRSTKL